MVSWTHVEASWSVLELQSRFNALMCARSPWWLLHNAMSRVSSLAAMLMGCIEEALIPFCHPLMAACLSDGPGPMLAATSHSA